MLNLLRDVIKVRSLLAFTGDRLVQHLGLTSAKWNVLIAIAEAESPQPVAWLARNMAAHRQNVQRIINELQKDGMVTFEANPHHRQAQLVVLTDKGRKTLAAVTQLQTREVNAFAKGLTIHDIETARGVILDLRGKLEAWRARYMDGR